MKISRFTVLYATYTYIVSVGRRYCVHAVLDTVLIHQILLQVNNTSSIYSEHGCTCTICHVQYIWCISVVCINTIHLHRWFMGVIPMHGTWAQTVPPSHSFTEPSFSETRPLPASSSRMELMSIVPPDQAARRGRTGGCQGHR